MPCHAQVAAHPHLLRVQALVATPAEAVSVPAAQLGVQAPPDRPLPEALGRRQPWRGRCPAVRAKCNGKCRVEWRGKSRAGALECLDRYRAGAEAVCLDKPQEGVSPHYPAACRGKSRVLATNARLLPDHIARPPSRQRSRSCDRFDGGGRALGATMELREGVTKIQKNRSQIRREHELSAHFPAPTARLSRVGLAQEGRPISRACGRACAVRRPDRKSVV